MATSIQAARTFLFVPADVPRRAAKALASEADAVILDLEDAVPAAGKEEARANLTPLLRDHGSGGDGPAVLVRVNDCTGAIGAADLRAVEALPVDGVVVPKADRVALAALPAECPPVVALVETAAGLLDSPALADDPRVVRLQLGAVDLCLDLGLRPLPDGDHLLDARSRLVLASAAAGLPGPIDAVFEEVADGAALEHEASRAAALGMRAKACIHPRQLQPAARAFAPTTAELEVAARIVAAFESGDGGAVAVDGRMVDLPVVELARKTLTDQRTNGVMNEDG